MRETTLLLVRYGELALKARETRLRFERILRKNISKALDREGIKHSIESEWGRIYIETQDITNSIPVLKKIFGVTSFSPSYKTEATIPSISELALQIARENIDRDKSFALRVTRIGNHSFSSQDIAVEVGEIIRRDTKAKVDLETPDIELFIEIRNKQAYLFTEKILGPGGLPLGSQGKVLTYVDQPEALLAAWYIMKRGCSSIFIVTNEELFPITERFTKEWYTQATILVREDTAPEDIQLLVEDTRALAVVTAHSLTKNTEQVISELQDWKTKISVPILTPLLTMMPKEIQEDAKRKEVNLWR